MPKNYLSRLKEYDARTSLRDKQSLYTKKFMKSCYSALSNQNQDPNVTHRHNHSQNRSNRKQKPEKSANTKSSDAKQSPPSDETAEQININPYQCEFDANHNSNVLFIVEEHNRKVICCEECSINFLNKTLFIDKENSAHSMVSEGKLEVLTNIRLQGVKLQRFLRQREGEQTEKCNNYYNFLLGQLKQQQDNALNLIKSSFHQGYEMIQRRVEKIEELILSLTDSVAQDPNSECFCSQLEPHDSQIAIEVLGINLNEEILRKAQIELSKLDLKHIGDLLSPSQQQQSATAVHEAPPGRQRPIEESLSCSQEFVDAKTTQTIKNQVDISFEQNEEFRIGADCAIISDTCPEPCGISPSFKYF